MAWVTPKTDWTSNDGVDFNDFNRIEGNIAFIATNPTGNKLRLAPDGGNSGFGTDNSQHTVEIIGASNIDGLQIRRSSITTDDSAYLGFRVSTSESATSQASIRGIRTNDPVAADVALDFFTGSDDFAMRIDTNGNVLIGTIIDAGETLQVDGSFRVTGTTDNVIIDTTGLLTAGNGIKTDSILEETGSAGVSILSGVKTDNTILKTKIIEIGDWNMDTTIAVTVSHGLTLANIRSVTAIIRNDTDNVYNPLVGSFIATVNNYRGGWVEAKPTTIDLARATGGTFDGTGYDATSYNRGWVTIVYES